MKLLLCALLLPFVVADPLWNDDYAKRCDAIEKHESFLEGDVYLKCNWSPKMGGSIEVIGCRSTYKNETMVPIGKEIKEEYDDAPGFEESCVKDGNNVTYSSKPLKSRNQAAMDKFCAENGRINAVFEHEGLLKKCLVEGGDARVEVVGCVYAWKLMKMAALQLTINKTASIEGNQTIKCVRDGQSAKIVGGEFGLCENKEGELIIAGTAYKKCAISKDNIYTIEIVGCVRRNLRGNTLDFVALNSTVALFEDGIVVKKCVIDGDTAKLISGSVDECYNRGDVDFRVDDMYKRCVREDDHYKIKIVGCAAKFEGFAKEMAESTKFGNRKHSGRIDVGDLQGFHVRDLTGQGKSIIYKCVLRGKIAVVISGDVETCEKRTMGEEFIDKRLYKVCSVNDTVYTAEAVGCVSSLTNDTLPVDKGIQVANDYNFCEKRGNSAQLLTGEEARKAMGEETVEPVSPVVTNATADGLESQSFNETSATFIFPYHRRNCSRINLDQVYSHYGTVYQCTVQSGHFVYKPVGCTPLAPLYNDDSFLRFGLKTKIVDDVYQYCEIDSQYSLRIQFEYKPYFASTSTPKARSAPLTCRNISVENALFTTNCIGEQTEGCLADVTCNDAPLNSSKFVCDEEMGWINVETRSKLDIEICVKARIAQNSTTAALVAGKVEHFCPNLLEVDNALITYSCIDKFSDGCEAEILCEQGFVHRKTQKVDKKYVCDPHKNWIDIETRVEMAKSPIDRCVAAVHRGRNLAIASPDGYYNMVSRRRDLAWACYFNGRQINENQIVFINDFVFTCAASKDDRLRLQFEGCSSDDLPANIAESMRSRNIAQCDFSKVNGEAAMFIANL